MIRDFSKVELEPATKDTELTLGAGAFLAIGGGLLILCAICFGFGYMVGHRSSPDQSAAAELPPPRAVTPASSGVKPEAATQVAARPQTPTTAEASGDGTTAQVEQVGATGGSSQAEVKPAVEEQVRPALAGPTQTAGNQVQGWMVQIAAVSRAEDAQVLVDALRKRGYEVTARRDASDNLIHVQTGPFVNRNDANAMRQKLLNDGYNAMVQ